MIDLVVLDMAGTTVDEGGLVYAALREAVDPSGTALAPADVEAWMGADKRSAIRALRTMVTGAATTDEEVARGYQDFRAILDRSYGERPPKPIAGVEGAFAALRAAGVKVALTTGFSRDVRDAIVATLGWVEGETVDAMVCTDDVAAGRPAPYMVFRAMERCGVVNVARVLVGGDTPRDLEFGMNAGAGVVVGVATGELSLEQLGRHRHTHLLSSAAELPALVASLR